MASVFLRFKVATLLGVAAMLTGCVQPAPPATQKATAAPPAPPALEARLHTEGHKIALSPDGKANALERNRLDAFIADLATKRRDALHATVGGTGNNLQLREAARMLAEDGIDPANIVLALGGNGTIATGPVTIEVEFYSVDAPSCAPWSTVVSATKDGSATQPDLGCSDLTNFAAMVSDPRDLMHDSTASYADGITSAAAVQRYNEDKVKPLPQSSGFGVAAGSGGGS